MHIDYVKALTFYMQPSRLGKKSILKVVLQYQHDSIPRLVPKCIYNFVSFYNQPIFSYPNLGHDTTASAISWILYSLAKHADIQDKVQEEVDAILDGKDPEVVAWYEYPSTSMHSDHSVLEINLSLSTTYRLHVISIIWVLFFGIVDLTVMIVCNF